MALNYERIGWENAPSTNTPIDAGSLNHMDNGILAVSNQYDVDVPYLQEQIAGIPAMLDSYLAEEIGTDVTAWLNAHVTPGGSTIVVDDTLTISGAAADSKTVGDALATKVNTSDVNAALATKADAEDLNQLETALSTKAEQDGAYPDLTAGQLLSKNEASDSVPYNFRAVGHDATLEYTDAIVGGTVAWNQLCYDNRTHTLNRDTERTTSVSTNNKSAIPDHVYCVFCNITRVTVNTAKLLFQWGVSATFSSEIGQNVYIGRAGTNTLNYVYAYISTDQPSGTEIDFKDFSIVDLTQMFGTAIADFLYSLGSEVGVAWLRKHFPKMFTYQPYNAGEIVSAQGLSQHVTVGFNQWDEEWEEGGISINNGQNVSIANSIRSKNYCKCLGDTNYCIASPKTQQYIFWYDSQQVFIGHEFGGTRPKVVTSPSNAYYFKIRIDAYGTTYNHDICINLSDPTRNGEYEPYQKRTYPLDSTKTFRGIFKLDASNNLYADGDRYLPDGTVQRRYGEITFNGSEKWKTNGSSGVYIFISDISAKPKAFGNIISEKYVQLPSGDAPTQDGYFNFNITGNALQFRDGNAMDETSWKAMLAQNPLKMIYELATPTTEEADHYTVPQIVDPDGTEEYVSTSIVPVGHESRYPLDIAGRLDKILTMPTANGTYTLRATVNNGSVTYAWVST